MHDVHSSSKRMVDQARKIEGEKKRIEQEMKQRQFVAQKKKLQEFSSIGSRKIDPDSYMKSLIGDSGPKQSAQKAQPQSQPQQKTISQSATGSQGISFTINKVDILHRKHQLGLLRF